MKSPLTHKQTSVMSDHPAEIGWLGESRRPLPICLCT
jgi:hypothetical protein